MDYLSVFTFVALFHLPLLWSTGMEAAKLNEYILDFQPLHFNPSHLHEKHSRVKRAIDPHLRWNFKAYGRTFNVHLSPATSIFAPDFRMDFGDGEEAVDTSFIYEGVLTDNLQSKVHLSILNDSLLGTIVIPGHNIYHIEPARKHMKDPKYPSIIYPESQMNLDPYRHKRSAVEKEDARCGSAALFEKLEKMSQPDGSPVHSYRKKRAAQFEKFSHNKYSAYYNSEVHSRKRRALIDNEKCCFMHLRADVLLYNHILQQQGSAQNAKEEILAMFSIHVDAIKRIYESTNFVRLDDSSVLFRGLTFGLRKATVMRNCSSIDQRYCTDNVDVSNYLDLTSLEDHSAFCLVHTFTYRDFIGGTLGLAWVASPNSPNAGVCGGFQRVRDGSTVRTKSLNTGITTLINFKKDIPSRVSQLTFAHEVGHNFGCQHDTTDVCAPYGTSLSNSRDGNYIMFPSANTGNLPNNEKFSECSRDDVAKILETMTNNGGSRTYCFEAFDAAFCGNGIVQGDEECDCGYVDDCDDKCCNARPLEVPNAAMCTRKSGSVCSPSQGKCCNDNCGFKAIGTLCQAEKDCTDESSCIGNASCPEPGHKPDRITFCSDYSGTCLSGQCLGSICENIGWEECSKSSSDADAEELCFVSCQKTNVTDCISSNDQTALDANTEFKALLQGIANAKNTGNNLGIKKPAGSSCNFKKGYCDVLSKCRSVNAEGPFKQLTELIFNPVTLKKIETWVEDYWWAVLLMSVGAIVFMVLFVKLFGYNTPSEDPKKKKRNAERRNEAGGGGGRARQPDKRSRPPPERAAVYTTDVPMQNRRDYGSNYGHHNYGYEGQEDPRRHQNPPSYPNYVGPHGQQGRAANRQQFDRVSVPKRY